MSRKALLAALGPLALLGGCGLSPMYAGGGSGEVARAVSSVAVAPIEGQSGWLVRNALVDRLGAGKQQAPRYRLDVRLDEKLQGLGLIGNDAITRERRTLRARYQLVDASNGAILLDATASADAGLDVVENEYAVIAAEQTALENLSHEIADQIVTRVAVRLRQAR
ncbi:LPS assembly lipoprotein LptE [Novosphingobium sp. KCTC 2891]|nr:LPS assembly lipoprotein LptE [Novosphingobium sp. KCTC 2891]MCW1383250.1 LPS assembly lipoprotein LptE [Novosphingobium sp. KCTC 2891]